MPPASSSARPTRGQLRIRRPPGTESRGIPVAPSAPSRGRPLVLVACVAVVGVVVAVAAWFVVSGRQSPTPATTTVRVSPTPTLTPVQRPTTNAFVDRLPSTTLQYALVSSEPEPAWVDAGAIEAYVEQFSDGGSGTFTLRAGQWSTAEAADAAFLAFTAGAERPAGATLPKSGRVISGESDVGRFTIGDAGDGNAVLTWSNLTVVVEVTGPVAQVERLFHAFPL